VGGRSRFSVVIPVYGNEDSVPALVHRLSALSARCGGELEAVFVLDGSVDDSLAVLRAALERSALNAQLVVLSRNFGAFAAIRTGLALAGGDFVAVMAADLQEPPEIVESFFDALETGECDIAIGQRVGRDDPPLSAAVSRLYWWAYRRLVAHDMPPGGVDVFGCTREVAQTLARFTESSTSLIGLVFWVGYRRKLYPYRRLARTHGHSRWTMRKRIRYLLDSIYAFTDLPILLLQGVGLVGVVGSFLVGIVVFGGWLVGSIRQPGYTPLMIALLASTSLLLLGLGVVGSYVHRSYENSMGRPISLVVERESYPRTADADDLSPEAPSAPVGDRPPDG
jgi:glycosyltransferase involved in cell wall biosynthesis